MDPQTAELEAIGEDFYDSLSELTFNSRPIISNLTQIAQENVNAAQFITCAVEKRIEKATPTQKLFAFYLLDSISKNVGSPYTLLFGTNLFQTFTQAYLLVDDPTRVKFIALFKTWKVPKTSSGLPLFPQEPIDKIERFLIKASTVYQQQLQSQVQQQQQQQQPRPSSNTPQLSAPSFQLHQQPFLPQLFQTIDRLLHLINQRLLANPQDTQIRSKLEVVNQLKLALQSESLPPQSLQAVANQLDEMTRHEESFLRNSAPPQPQQSNLANLLSVKPPMPNNSHPIPTDNTNKNPLGLLNSIASLKTPSSLNSQSKTKTDISSLISTLHKTGLVKSKSSIPSNTLLKSLLINQTSSSTSSPISTPQPQTEFSKYDLSSKNLFHLDPSDTFRSIFIAKYPNKCGQCGKRFDNSEKGSNLRRDHLDWHFRMNKKLKDGFVAQSKIWYLDDEQFVNFRDSEVFNKNYDNEDNEFGNNNTGNNNNNNNTDSNTAKNFKRRYVVVPSDSSDMSCVCGICKETLRGQYDDELGEWIWPNAIESKGKIFHLNCFNETNKNSNPSLSNLINVKRSREDSGAGSGNEKRKMLNINGIDMNMLKNIVDNVKPPSIKQEKA